MIASIVDANGRTISEPERKFASRSSFLTSTTVGGAITADAIGKVSWVYACVKRKADALVQLRYYLTSEDGEGEEITRGPVYDLLRNPNPVFRWEEILTSLSYWLDIAGEAHWNVVMAGSRPAELWPFDPRYMNDLVDLGTDTLTGWDYREQGRSGRYPLEEIITWRNLWNARNKYRGLSPLKSATLAISQDYAASRFNERALAQGGGVGGLYHTPEPLTEDQQDQIANLIRAKYAGPDAAGRPLLLHSGLNYTATSWSPQEIMVEDLRRMTMKEICAVLQVPSILIDGEASSYANYSEASKSFWVDTVQPRAKTVARVLTLDLCDRYQPGTQIAVDTSGVEELQENLGLKLENAAKLLGQGYTINQVNERLDLGMDEAEWGDTAFLANGYQTVERASANPFAAFNSGESQVQRAPRWRTRRKQQDPVRAATWESIMTPFERIGARTNTTLQEYYGDLRGAMLRKLSVLYKPAKADVNWPSGEELTDELMAVIGTQVDPMWGRIVNYVQLSLATSVNQVADEAPLRPATMADLGITADSSLDDVAEALRQRLVGPFSTYLNSRQLQITQTEVAGPLRQALSDTLSEGTLAGESFDEITDRIKAVFKDESVVSPMRIARTETSMAQSYSRNESYQAAEVERIEWLTARDEAVRGESPLGAAAIAQANNEPFAYESPDHRALDGYIIPAGGEFPNGLNYPGQSGGSAAEVINCRCTSVAVIDWED